KFTALCLLSSVFLAGAAQGATINAATCNVSDVQTAVNSASSGDTVTIPAGACAWTQTLTIKKAITLSGSGTANSSVTTFAPSNPTTVITHQGSGGLISVSGLTNGQTVRISLLDIEPSGNGSPITITGTCNSAGCPLFRVDNIIWGKTSQWAISA